MQMQSLGFLDIGLVTIFVVLYFLPSFIALVREHKNRLAIFLLNLLLGWTVLGWVGSLVWSTMK